MEKSLLDIQQEIRDVEQQVNALSNSIAEIYKDIDNLRNDEIALIDYQKIQLLSTLIMFEKHPLGNLDNKKLCQAYVELLLRLVHLDKSVESTINRLVFVQWLVKQAELDLSLEELFVGALKRDTDNLTLVIESMTSTYYDQLLMDALLVANISGKANEEILIFIVDLCRFFNVNKDKLKAFSIISKSILQKDSTIINQSGCKDTYLYVKQFEHYLEHNVLSRAMSEQRVLVAKIYENASYDLIWIKDSGYYLDTGDVICTYRDFRKSNSTNKCVIEAPCEGRLYRFKEGNVNYVVIHPDKDNLLDVRSWALTRR